MRGYKVLTRKRRSGVMVLSQGGRYYRIGETVKSKRGYGPLCVFTHKAQAARFARSQVGPHEWIVAKCKYTPSSYRGVWAGLGAPVMHSLPSGTALATTVTCLE